jgi:multiple sugar transport system substrate-binding protein
VVRNRSANAAGCTRSHRILDEEGSMSLVSEMAAGRRLLALGAGIAIVVGACGSSATPAPSNGGASSAPTAGTATSAPGGSTAAGSGTDTLSGTLRVDFLAYDAKMQPWVDEMKKEFNAIHPNVNLTLEIPNLDQYRDSLTTQAQGGNPPDVAQVATSWMPALADAGVLEPWDTAGYSADLLGQMDPTLRDGAKYNGQLYGLSYGASARAVFYNSDEYTKAGISAPPTTWDEFLSDMQKIKSTGAAQVPFVYEGKGQEAMAAWFPYVYFSYGGSFTDSSGKLAIDKNICVQALTVYDTMNKDGLFEPNVTASDINVQQKDLTSGTASTTITGPWGIGWYTADKSTQKYSSYAIPKGTTQATVGVTDAFALFKSTKNQAAALAFTEFLMDPARNLQFVKDRGFLPIYTSQFSLPDFQNGPIKAFTDALTTAKFIPLNSNWTQFDKIGTNAITAMYLNKTGPDTACQAMIDGLAGITQ